MRKRNIIGKTTSIILAFTLCITSFTGCGKKKITEEDLAQVKQIDKNCIFKQEDFPGILGEGEKVCVLGRSGGKVAAICEAETGDGGFKYLSFNPDGSEVNSCDFGGKKEDYITIGTFDNEGNAYLVYKEHKGGDDYSSFLEKITPTGEIAYKFDLSEEFADDPFYFRCFEWSDKYGLLCGTENGVKTYDEQNGLKELVDKKVMSGMEGILDMVELPNNKLFINYYNKLYAQSFVIVDVDNKKVEKKLGDFQEHSYYDFFDDENGNLYASDSYGVYKCDTQADKLVKLLDYRDSSINYDDMMSQVGFFAVNEKEIIADTSEGDSGVNTLVKLSKVNPEDVADKTVITLSGMYVDRDIASQIMEFNRSSDKYAIKILDYSEFYNDYEQCEKQFNLDITAGKAADIICFSGNEASVRKYADKGILLDLTPAFENGGPLSDIEVLPNIAEMMKFNGKTYTFMPTFRISTYAVKSEYAKGKNSLTYKDCDELINSKGVDYKTAFGSYDTRSNVCAYFWTYYGDEFFDLKNKKCNFNTPEFAEFLNFANKFPDEEPVDCIMEDELEAVYAEGKGIFYAADFRNIWQYAKLKQYIFRDDVELVGCPNNLGKNMAAVSTTTLGVNSKTEHADVIYDLIRELMTSDKETSDGFSTVKPKFEEELKEATGEISDSNTKAQTYDPLSGKDVKLEPLSEEDIKKFYDYAVSINTNVGYDMQVTNIISEEASAFFKGKKTAEQVGDIIQNRISNYIAENS